MSKFLADENFPVPSHRFLVEHGVDIVHIGIDLPSISDKAVIEKANEEQRVIITLDRDHGDLIFLRKVKAPIGIVYFQLPKYRPTELGERMLIMIEDGFKFEDHFTVIAPNGIRQRAI